MGVLLLSLVSLTAAAVVAWRWPVYRRQAVLGALFSLPILGLEFLSAGSLDRLGPTSAAAVQYLVVTAMGIMGVGALAAVLAERTVGRWLSSSPHHRRHLLLWSLLGVGVSGGLLIAGLSLGLSLLVGLTVNAICLSLIDRELLWDAVVGAVAFGLWFGLADVLFGIRAAGDIRQLLFGPTPIGLTFAGLPIERLVIGALAGAFIGPLFSATKQFRQWSSPVPRFPKLAKVMAGLAVALVGTLSTAWVAFAYVLPPTTTGVVTPAAETDPAAPFVRLTFSRPVNRDTLQLTITPSAEGHWVFSRPSYSDHGFHQADFIFSETLVPGATYNGTVSGIESVWGLRSPDTHWQFTTSAPPAVGGVIGSVSGASVTLANATVDPCQPISVLFTTPADDRSAFDFATSPAATLTVEQTTDRGGYRLQPQPCLAAGTAYHLTVTRRDLIRDTLNGEVVQELPATVVQDVTFSTVAPPIPTPAPAPIPVEPPKPVPTPAPVSSTARTQRILPIAQDYQDQPLSCEAAALKMALAGQGVKVSERQIMDIVGYDPTPHSGNVWGDPDVAFVGNIAGKQNTTGYGVYWGPIAKAGARWRPTRVLNGGTPEILAAEIYAGHPVVIWGTLGRAYRQTWMTPKGKTVRAWKGEHARTVIGVVGSADHPTKFIINDPVAGRLTWSRETLVANWSRFDYQAVVVE